MDMDVLRSKEDKELMLQEADQWVSDNPQAWEYMCSWAEKQARGGVPFTTTELSYAVKHSALVCDKHGRPRSFKNALRAPIARLLLRKMPYIKPYMLIRPSKTDVYFDDVIGGKEEKEETDG